MLVAIWGPGDGIAARFDLALQGLSTLDYFVRHSINGVSDAVLPNRLSGLRGMPLTDWELQRRGQEEYEERAAVMQMYAAFEGALRRDAEWRGFEPVAHFHEQFKATAQRVRDQKFVRLSQWLNCWRAAIATAAVTPSVQIAALNLLQTSFSNERNPLMHTDRAPFPPLGRVQQQLTTAYASLRELANDFGACDAP